MRMRASRRMRRCARHIPASARSPDRCGASRRYPNRQPARTTTIRWKPRTLFLSLVVSCKQVQEYDDEPQPVVQVVFTTTGTNSPNQPRPINTLDYDIYTRREGQ